jgi:large subunit ribosomal protein L10
MKKDAKKLIIDKVRKTSDKAKVTILTDYKGMTVKSVTELKKKLKANNAEMKIVKNTLFARVIGKEYSEAFKPLLEGQTAIIFGMEDPIAPVKVLVTFITENEKPVLKGGIFEGKFVTVEQIKAISKLPGRQELIAKVVWGIKSPLSGLVYALKGNINKLVWALDAVKNKKGN